METKISIKNADDLKIFLAKNYLNQIKNFFGDERQAMKFLSSVMSSVQRLPKLLECEKMSVINSFMTMAQLGLMPSDISGEAYVLPYNIKGILTAQFQLGYQGLITLFYKAGVQGVRSEIVREHDEFSYENGVIRHKIDIFKSNEERGLPIGAYAIGIVNGIEIAKAMNKKDILAMSKFAKGKDTAFTPWKEENDPELWMWKKTVLKQLGKLMPKNESINRAIAEDNKGNNVGNGVEHLVESSNLKMGNLLKTNNEKNEKEQEEKNNNEGPEISKD